MQATTKARAKVFFAFHYAEDFQKVSNIRSTWANKSNIQEAGYIDLDHWNDINQKGKDHCYKWIDQQLNESMVTVLFIGAETARCEYAQYVIQKSRERENDIIGIRLDGEYQNPLDIFEYCDQNKALSYYDTFDWHAQQGHENFEDWLHSSIATVKAWRAGAYLF